MKTQTLGLMASLGMLLVGGATYAVTPAGGFAATPEPKVVASNEDDDAESKQGGGSSLFGDSSSSLTQFSSGKTVRVEGRVGQGAMLGTGPQETFVMLEMKGDAGPGKGEAPRVNLSLVIDKSGSMRGSRFANALSAAQTAVERLRDGDTVSVIAFDTKTETVVPATTINPSSRSSAIQSIRNIQLGGDTCISCGIEEGLVEIKRAQSFSGSDNGVDRMILLSDGEPTSGVRDVSSFRTIAQRAMTQNVTVTTIGVDVDFNENIMSAIALASNGRHYFVENDRDLVRVFESEAQTLEESVASDSVAEIELGPGVELVQVFDRTFSRSGSRVSVPLGAFSKGETKTVLLKVRAPAGADGDVELVKVDVAYRDLISGKDVKESGKLGFARVSDNAKVTDLDGLVVDRVQRSETAAALRDANSLFVVGKADEARRRLAVAQESLNKAKATAPKRAPSGRAKDINDSFDNQEAELNRASGGFASPPPADAASPGAAPQPAPRQQKVEQKRNAESATKLAL
ncbi:MAG: VWA domain-containing protein [Polyangiaceae bacterium]|nr:VWA domain-containing protein [Polyangiaceae bacterium]